MPLQSLVREQRELILFRAVNREPSQSSLFPVPHLGRAQTLCLSLSQSSGKQGTNGGTISVVHPGL